MAKTKTKIKTYKVKLTKIQVEDLVALVTSRVEAVDSNLKKEYDLHRRETLRMVRAFSLTLLNQLVKPITPKKKLLN